MYCQFDPKWANERLGTGSTTIGTHGCYLTCLCEGLNRHEYNYTPKTLNNLFKQTNTYTSGNLLTSTTVATKNPSLFTFGRNEVWDDNNVRNYLKQSDIILIGEVDGRGIGGTGQHFVLILGLVENNGKITNTKIGDPWGGLENLVSVRYSKYGYIKSLRVFGVKVKAISTSSNTIESGKDEMQTLEFLDCRDYQTAERKLIEHLGINGKKCAWGDASGKDTGGHLGSERRRVKALEDELADRKEYIERIEDNELKNKKELHQLRNQVNTFEETIINKNKQLEQLQKEMTTLKTQCNIDYITSLERENSELKTQISGMTVYQTQEEWDRLQQYIKQLENRSLWEMLVNRLKELLG